jgi:hypothetical protein
MKQGCDRKQSRFRDRARAHLQEKAVDRFRGLAKILPESFRLLPFGVSQLKVL